MARPRIGEEKRASTGIALRVTQEMKDDVDRYAKVIDRLGLKRK